jgi:hypothetical protein
VHGRDAGMGPALARLELNRSANELASFSIFFRDANGDMLPHKTGFRRAQASDSGSAGRVDLCLC